jgi:hypothetical protein
MKTGDYVRLRKLAATENPLAPTPHFATYKQGEDNGMVSFPVEYTITGLLLLDVQVGTGLHVSRDSRNGEQCSGLMQTSPVTKLEPGRIFTNNSIYEIEIIRPANQAALN